MVGVSVGLFILGIVFLGIEIFVPGFGIFGISGITALILSWIVSFFYLPYSFTWIAVEILAVLLLLLCLYKIAKYKKIKDKIILGEAVAEDESIKKNSKNLIGKEGVVKTPLRPFGNITMEDGSIIDVCSEDGYIERDCNVRIVSLYENKFFVRKIN